MQHLSFDVITLRCLFGLIWHHVLTHCGTLKTLITSWVNNQDLILSTIIFLISSDVPSYLSFNWSTIIHKSIHLCLWVLSHRLRTHSLVLSTELLIIIIFDSFCCLSYGCNVWSIVDVNIAVLKIWVRDHEIVDYQLGLTIFISLSTVLRLIYDAWWEPLIHILISEWSVLRRWIR